MPDTNPPTVPATVPATVSPDPLADLDIAALAEGDEAQDAASPPAAEPEAPATEEVADEATVAAETTTADGGDVGADAVAEGEVSPEPEAEADAQAATQPSPPSRIEPPAQPDPAIAAAEQARQQRDARLKEINAEIIKLREVSKDDYDPFEHGRRISDLLLEKDALNDSRNAELQQQVEAAAAHQRRDQYWAEWARLNPDVGTRGRDIFQQELEAAFRKYPNPEIAQAVATEKWETRVGLVRAQARARTKPEPAKPAARPAAKSAKPAEKPPAKLIPTGAVGRPPVSEADPEDDFVRSVGGSIRSLMG